MARVLYNEGYRSVEDIASADAEELVRKAGISQKTVERIIASAREKLTGPQVAEEVPPEGDEKVSLEALPGVGAKTLALLNSQGFETVMDVARSTIEKLSEIPSVGEKRAQKLIAAAKALTEERKNGE
jgi:transcription termination factor NusA